MTSAIPRRALALTCAAALGTLGLSLTPSAFAAGAPASSGGAARTTLAGSTPHWLAHAQKQATATAATAAGQSVRVYLAPRGGLAALKATVASLSDPASAQYHHWLTTAQYDATFAPSAASAAAVSSYLRSQGLTVTGVEKNRRYVSATGTRAQLGVAFGTTLATYRHDGQTVTANASAVSLPASVGSSVLTVTGLDTTVTKKAPQHVVPGATGDAPTLSRAAKVDPNATPPGAFQNGRPCAINFGNPLALYKADYKTPLPQFGGQTLPYAPCGYTGPSFRAAYEGGTPLNGAGVTVAITDAYAWQFIAKDANTYASQHGDGSYAPGQLTQSFPPAYTHRTACDPSGWSGEETLDVEAVHAMAPAAKIKYYASASCFDADFLETLGRVVDDNQATIVTNSWSDLEANTSAASVAAYEQIFLQGATQGITFLFSSGDNGDELAKTAIKQVDYPASDPYATAAGGTSTGIANGTLTAQTGWGTHNASLSANGKRWIDSGFLYGAGGGYSALFNQPAFQNGVVPTTAPPGRAVPDIAMDADPNTGMLVGQTQTFPDSVHYGEYRIGGTSLASPLLAGMMALANQGAGTGFGWANPLLYSAPKGLITDITHKTGNGIRGVVRVNNNNGIDPTDGLSYFVRTFDQDSSLATAPGWDPVTGIGVP
ncbi:MAG: S53 family peptidase, partial [Actinomycetota bacterium]|nr:S53 family peptidase [Actinomycetota bacterium]